MGQKYSRPEPCYHGYGDQPPAKRPCICRRRSSGLLLPRGSKPDLFPHYQRPKQHTIAAEGVHFALWSSIMSVGGGLGEIFVNHDARMHIAGEHAIPELLEAHKRSKYLTNLMLLVSGVSGALAYQQTKDNYWLIGSGLMLAGIPYCALVEYPVAEQLKFLTLDAKSEKARTLLASWGGIQLGKLALAVGGATIFYWFARR
ncbi:unnamed protein product [Adineta ricciae]|uniref:DUF1772 domain-containing protein n=1 Tax=Adineta ricciae TaxID=249248 RepID=A0A815W8R1_ADIRI|nr:unnamed protein product [Adineta ricciae]CAF1542742.1 unnamed protein product [Adineta ricciae]